MICSGNTNIGMRRRVNQDAFKFHRYTERTSLYVVCDGMGGAKSGEVASKLAAETFVEVINQFIEPIKRKNKPVGTSDIKRALAKAVDIANERVYTTAKKNEECNGMGTTLVAALVIDKNVFIINVGDSRLYKIKNNTIKQITKDHSWVQEMVDMGRITPEEAKNSTNKNIITRAVGTNSMVEGTIYQLKVEDGDFLLLCTDGLTGMVEDDVICNIVSNDRHSSRLDQVELDLRVRKLIDTANKNGGHDNITVVLVRI